MATTRDSAHSAAQVRQEDEAFAKRKLLEIIESEIAKHGRPGFEVRAYDVDASTRAEIVEEYKAAGWDVSMFTKLHERAAGPGMPETIYYFRFR